MKINRSILKECIFGAMFQLGKTIVSEDILEKEFVCNLTACKGACCIKGEAGAPGNRFRSGNIDRDIS